MNRAEWAAWAKGLKSGDNVIVKARSRILVDVVKRVTPSGWIVTLRNGTYSMSKWFDYYTERGGFKDIVPYTEELAEEAKRQKEELERQQKIDITIRRAKNIAYDWQYGNRNVDYDLACKILALAGVEVKSQ